MKQIIALVFFMNIGAASASLYPDLSYLQSIFEKKDAVVVQAADPVQEDEGPSIQPPKKTDMKPQLPEIQKQDDEKKPKTPKEIIMGSVKQMLKYGAYFLGGVAVVAGIGAALGSTALLVASGALLGVGILAGVVVLIGLLLGAFKVAEQVFPTK